MSNLKEYVVIKHVKHDSPAIWTKKEWDSYKSNPNAGSDYIIITTFNADEELKEGEIETLKAENSKMRKALEGIQAKINALIEEDTKGRAIEVAIIMANCTKEILSIATEALK